MKRREFTSSLAAFGLAPMLPAQAVAKLAAPAAAIPAANTGYSLIFIDAFAKYYVSKIGHSSPQMLVEHFKVSPELARGVTKRLIDAGVLGAPNALGISQSLKPTYGEFVPKVRKTAEQVFDLTDDEDEIEAEIVTQEEISDTQAGTTSDA